MNPATNDKGHLLKEKIRKQKQKNDKEKNINKK
jgi:hypothetical protein